jgi:hypothetical protein
MHRRDFLKLLLSTPVAAQLDVEKMLWVPGERTIFLPPTIQAIDWGWEPSREQLMYFTREGLEILYGGSAGGGKTISRHNWRWDLNRYDLKEIKCK